MGSYNNKLQRRNIAYLGDDRCPLCGNLASFDTNFRLEADTVDYHCLNCLPDGNYITITGSLLGTYIYPQICLNGSLNGKARRLVLEKNGEFRKLATSDFRE